ncbi:hypothetical protein DIPPA_34676 [Diplonema papillatum]|nr:hypothetical protein DIPPA_34676 [Diplonema papillatum]
MLDDAAIVVLFLMTGRAGEGRCEAADVFGGEKWRTEQTLAARTVFSTRFGRCEVHKVSTDRGTVADWLWFDGPNAANVVVH